MIETVRYDGLFAFMYSDRPLAPATAFSDKVAEAVKKERLQTLLDRQAIITREKHEKIVGDVRRVLVEGPSRDVNASDEDDRSHQVRWTGRTSSNHIVHFSDPQTRRPQKEILTGEFADIMIEGAYAHSLWGRLADGSVGSTPEKGESSIAA